MDRGLGVGSREDSKEQSATGKQQAVGSKQEEVKIVLSVKC